MTAVWWCHPVRGSWDGHDRSGYVLTCRIPGLGIGAFLEMTEQKAEQWMRRPEKLVRAGDSLRGELRRLLKWREP